MRGRLRLLVVLAVLAAGVAAWFYLHPLDRGRSTLLVAAADDASADLYRALDAAFAADRQRRTGRTPDIRLAERGTEADIVTGAYAPDASGTAAQDDAPFHSAVVFLVRRDNPKQVHDWNDLIEPGVAVVAADPKVSDAARWPYIAAWTWGVHQAEGREDGGRDFVTALYRNVSGLGASTAQAADGFLRKGDGDVLLTSEAEAMRAHQRSGGAVEVVRPSLTVRIDPSVRLAAGAVEAHRNRALAEAYLAFLRGPEAQTIAARNFYRPAAPAEVPLAERDRFPGMTMATIDALGGWPALQAKHFAEGGLFDQIRRSDAAIVPAAPSTEAGARP